MALRHSQDTGPQHLGAAVARSGRWALQPAFCCSCRDSPRDNVFLPFTTQAQRKSQFLFVPRLHLSQGLAAVVPLPWAKGNTDPSATAQSHKAQLLLLTVLTPRLLTLGFIRAGAFPAVRLPLLVQTADADSLPPADGDVLLHEACQHACRGRGRQTCPVLECWYCPCQSAALPLSPKTDQRAPPGTIELEGHRAETCGSPD